MPKSGNKPRFLGNSAWGGDGKEEGGKIAGTKGGSIGSSGERKEARRGNGETRGVDNNGIRGRIRRQSTWKGRMIRTIPAYAPEEGA